MTFDRFNRRLHLYLAMFLLPWFFLYGLSSLPFSHGEYFQKLSGPPQRMVHFDRPYSIDIPPGADLKTIGAKILADNGVQGDFGTYRPNGRELVLYLPNFLSPTEVRYFADRQRVVSTSPAFRWSQFLTRIHTRGGFEHASFASHVWAYLVDLTCLGLLVWMASGICMWWNLRATRLWGAVALAAGLTAFALFLIKL
ncbi:MAG: hypothetical protein HY822_06650 [Acidobacteria bacterium]|nr:hypothetical protein [Acidobacteriota bacterium]